MTRWRAIRRPALLAAMIVLALAPATSAAAATARASLTDIENDVMCVACREPLSVAQSPQAISERQFVRSLIAQGLSKQQIERQLVAQYGPAVLGRPPASGFNLTVYVLPPAILLLGIGLLAIALPRWRRRSRDVRERPAPAGQPLEAADERRLEEELNHYRG